ncbi:aldehyde dehydrogenase family protein [Saccharopolyspora sp. NPDC000995]
MSDNRIPERLAVAKTYKLYIGGSFPRSESGRVYPVHDRQGAFLANAAQASRKDVRDAVAAARKAFGGWSGATAYNRGQVLFRIAEVMEGRREQFAAEISAAEGLPRKQARSTVDETVDRMVWYAGWTDKISMVLGAANPVAGPYFSFSVPEPTGVVGVLAPPDSSLLGLISVVAPVIAAGNTCVVVASTDRPLPAVTFAEALATSDVPDGVVNVLTGQAAELAPWLASHADVNALDPTGATEELRAELAKTAADTVKRVLPVRGEADWTREPDLQRLRAFTEVKTVWHPVGT